MNKAGTQMFLQAAALLERPLQFKNLYWQSILEVVETALWLPYRD